MSMVKRLLRRYDRSKNPASKANVFLRLRECLLLSKGWGGGYFLPPEAYWMVLDVAREKQKTYYCTGNFRV